MPNNRLTTEEQNLIEAVEAWDRGDARGSEKLAIAMRKLRQSREPLVLESIYYQTEFETKEDLSIIPGRRPPIHTAYFHANGHNLRIKTTNHHLADYLYHQSVKSDTRFSIKVEIQRLEEDDGK